MQEISKVFNGIDPADEGKKGWMPVRPMQHYSMGGIRTKPTGEAKSLKGLFSCGEAACWDLHGFNRLGGNSVAETVVSGMIVGSYFADYIASHEEPIPLSCVHKCLDKQIKYIDDILKFDGKEDIYAIKRRMQEIMDEKSWCF